MEKLKPLDKWCFHMTEWGNIEADGSNMEMLIQANNELVDIVNMLRDKIEDLNNLTLEMGERDE